MEMINENENGETAPGSSVRFYVRGNQTRLPRSERDHFLRNTSHC